LYSNVIPEGTLSKLLFRNLNSTNQRRLVSWKSIWNKLIQRKTIMLKKYM